MTESEESGRSPAPRRRPRYRGTHPRRFEERYKELKAEAYPEIVEQVRARGGTPAGTHVSILLPETMEALVVREGDIVADCTLGYGGHAAEFLKRVGPNGRVVGFDLDAEQLARTGSRLSTEFAGAGLELRHSNYAGIDKQLPTDAAGRIGYDVIFADLGVSSMQVDDPGRGFTYKHDGPLDMRMDRTRKRSAADFLRTLTERELAEALSEYADEPDAAPIAGAIVRQRERSPIVRTQDLVQIIFEVKRLSPRHWREELAARLNARLGRHHAKHVQPDRLLHPAALTFQALRILVNDELASLSQLLRVAPYCLKPGGRIGLITFHSGEDRRVEQALGEGLSTGAFAAISEQPIRPSPQEQFDNPRSRSARLRWARREVE